jgi:hypothetical protein
VKFGEGPDEWTRYDHRMTEQQQALLALFKAADGQVGRFVEIDQPAYYLNELTVLGLAEPHPETHSGGFALTDQGLDTALRVIEQALSGNKS